MYIHLLWSTKDQKPLIGPSITQSLYPYLCQMALTHECHAIAGQVCQDHVQIIIKISPNTRLSDLITTLKVASSIWMRTNFPALRDFEWQKSDFSFSVSFEEVGSLIEKIKQAQTFLSEIPFVLEQNGMKYEPSEMLE